MTRVCLARLWWEDLSLYFVKKISELEMSLSGPKLISEFVFRLAKSIWQVRLLLLWIVDPACWRPTASWSPWFQPGQPRPSKQCPRPDYPRDNNPQSVEGPMIEAAEAAKTAMWRLPWRMLLILSDASGSSDWLRSGMMYWRRQRLICGGHDRHRCRCEKRWASTGRRRLEEK